MYNTGETGRRANKRPAITAGTAAGPHIGRVSHQLDKSKVKLSICGEDYLITTDDDVKYVQSLGDELDMRLTRIMRENSRLSVTQAAVLAALEYLDSAKKAEQSAENLRSQIQEYLEDAARAKTNAEIHRREAERLGKELAAQRARFSNS
ncbi:MAG: Cell division protein ZapA [Firmicutes bacterium ADurb.Bin262]|nr:MAG: Cell division protein ZapA [Firmicutes bacterium ADurb.Bin262]